MALNRGLIVGLAWAAGVALAQAPQPAAPKLLADTVYDSASRAMFWGDWDGLERLHAAARIDLQRSDDGALAACRFGHGVSRDYDGETQAYHETRVATTLDWARSRPESPLAHAVHLDALVRQAWFLRGGGYAKEVSDQRFAEFKAKLNEALAYAKAQGAVMGRDSYSVRVLIPLLRGLDVSVKKQLEIARKGLRNDVTDECIYAAVLPSLLPKWGGEPEQLEGWVREAMKGLPEKAALKRYAWLYSVATADDYGQRVFDASMARWPLMRDGLRALIEDLPKGRYWKNRLAYFACMVKDRETAVPALEAIEADPYPEAWGPTGQRNYLACKRWALQS